MTAVGVVGASARAAVGSLLRAGFAAWAADLFADRDLIRMAPAVRCPAHLYPDALPGLTEPFPPGPVLYTGGLENHPQVVRQLAARRELWGNGPEVLERIRDPFFLTGTLRAAGLPVPRLAPRAGVAPPGRWLRKPLYSAGGHGIRLAIPGEPPTPDAYVQERIDGPPRSALFMTTANEGTRFIHVTEQLVGESWLHAAPFCYCGNIGPVPPSRELEATLGRIAQTIATDTGVQALWGIDFILHDGTPYLTEVNPRYTASVEVLELGTGTPLLAPHVRRERHRPGQIVGKAIYFAPQRLTFPTTGPWDAELNRPFDPWRVPEFADIPEPGEVIEPGWPVLTVFATGSTPDTVRGKLQAAAANLDSLWCHDGQRSERTHP